MPLKPIFEIGLWNAWIPGLFLVLHPLLVRLLDHAIGSGDMDQKMGGVPSLQREKSLQQIPVLLLIILFILTIFLPLQLGTVWFYSGLLVYLFGLAVFLCAIITAVKTPPGQIFSGGAYRYSRHPMYLSFLAIFISISLVSASWIFLVLSLGWMVFPLSQVNAEERDCIKKFGSDYLGYMHRTPKWLGIPRSA